MFGILLSFLFLHFFPSTNLYFFVFLVCLGSVLVDIDTSNSKIGRKLKPFSWFFEFFFSHRGFLHSLTAAFLLLLFSVYLVSLNLLAFAPVLGYLGHISLDAFTLSGVPLLKPFSNKRLSGPVATGSISEYIIFLLIVASDIYLLVLGI